MSLSPRDDPLSPDALTPYTFVPSPAGGVRVVAFGLTVDDARTQEILGIVACVNAGVICVLFLYFISHLVHRGPRGSNRSRRSEAIATFLSSDLGLSFCSLLVFDLLGHASTSANLAWARDFSISAGPLCDYQGALNQFSILGNAACNLLIAVQTFILLVVQVKPRIWHKILGLSLVWIFAVIMAILGPLLDTAPFSHWGATGAGCWIGIGTSDWQAWFRANAITNFTVSGSMMVIYLVIFLKLSGMFGPVKTGEGERRSQRRIRAVARRMLYFPMAYCLLSTPVFVLLIITSKGTLIAHDPVVVAGTAFNMIGCVDVLIFLLTRKGLLPQRSGGGLNLSGSGSGSNPFSTEDQDATFSMGMTSKTNLIARELGSKPPKSRRPSIDPRTGSVRWTTSSPLQTSPKRLDPPAPAPTCQSVAFSSSSSPRAGTTAFSPTHPFAYRTSPAATRRNRNRRSRSVDEVVGPRIKHAQAASREEEEAQAEYRSWLAPARRSPPRPKASADEEEAAARRAALDSLRGPSPESQRGDEVGLKRTRSFIQIGERVKTWIDPGPWGEAFEKEGQPGRARAARGREETDRSLFKGDSAPPKTKVVKGIVFEMAPSPADGVGLALTARQPVGLLSPTKIQHVNGRPFF